jgi:hypothetical protein
MEEITQQTIDQLASLAQQADLDHTIDWSKVDFTQDEMFRMMASQVLEQLNSIPEQDRAAVAMATMTKLLVENFALNFQLKEKIDGSQ